MKKSLLQFCILFSVTLAHAQQTAPHSSVPPLPPGPLLNRTPGFCRWTVITRAESGAGQKSSNSGAASAKKPDPVREATYTKTGTLILEEYLLSSGRIEQHWHSGAMQAMIRADGSPPIISSGGGGGGDFDHVDFAHSDFAGLDWISAQTYTGILEAKGRKCLVFQGTILPMTSVEVTQTEMVERGAALEANARSAHPVASVDFRFDRKSHEVPTTAYIDLETRLPMLMTFGGDKPLTRDYIYQTATPPMLTLPPVLASALAQMSRTAALLAQPPPQP